MIGLVAVNKDSGPTSRYVTTKISRICGVKHTGHSGTLDPLAEGVLPVMVGRACKLIPFLKDSKEYIATMQFGIKTDTGDITGTVLEKNNTIPVFEQLENACGCFIGEITQTPPMYSALKKNGVPLYEYARKNIPVEASPRTVRIDSIELIEMSGSTAVIKVACGGGTYIRTLCEDIAEKCGALATMTALQRTVDAGIPISASHSLFEIEEAFEKGKGESMIISPEELFMHLPELIVSESGVNHYCNGGIINKERLTDYKEGAIFRVYSPSRSFLGLGQTKNNGIKALWVM